MLPTYKNFVNILAKRTGAVKYVHLMNKSNMLGYKPSISLKYDKKFHNEMMYTTLLFNDIKKANNYPDDDEEKQYSYMSELDFVVAQLGTQMEKIKKALFEKDGKERTDDEVIEHINACSSVQV